MFYIKELYLRFYYLIFSSIIVLGVLWLYKKNLLTLLTFSLLNKLVTNSEIFFEHLIYTNPAEVFYTYLSLILCFSLLLILPLFIWHTIDFLRSSLYNNEFYTLNYCITGVFCFVCLTNTFSVLIIFPYIWNFFNLFNKSNELTSLLNFSLELRVQEYFNFFFSFLYLVNLSTLFFLILMLFLSRLDLKKKVILEETFYIFQCCVCNTIKPPRCFFSISFFIYTNCSI